MEFFGQRLKERIAEKGLSQKQFAKAVGITEGAVAHYIKGQRFPTYSVLCRISAKYGWSMDELMGIKKYVTARDRLIIAVKEAMRNDSVMTYDYGEPILLVNSNEVDHIAENVADWVLVNKETL